MHPKIDCPSHGNIANQSVCEIVARRTGLPLEVCHTNQSACEFCLKCGIPPETPNLVISSMSFAAAKRAGEKTVLVSVLKQSGSQFVMTPKAIPLSHRARLLVGTLLDTAWRLLTFRKIFVSKAVIKERLTLCVQCEYFSKDKCSLCKCKCNTQKKFMNKLSHASSECPIKKWGPV